MNEQEHNQTANQEVQPQHQENIMGTMDVNRLLIKLSLPMMASMLVQALYNVVDSVFISRVSEEALTAISLAFSIQNFMIALGVGIGVGVNALLSRALGEKNRPLAQRIANNGMFLGICCCIMMMCFAIFAVKPYFTMQTTDAEIVREGVNYLFICCLFSQGLFVQLVMEKLLAATGNTQQSMLCQMSGAVTNIILDPIFIFGYCGETLSGARGAAIATVIGQTVAGLVGLYFCQRAKSEMRLELKGFRPNWQAIVGIFEIGVPSIAMMSVGSVMVLGMNQILMKFTSTAVAVFGVYFRLQSFVFMPVFGLTNALMPILGYNYGAKQPKRLTRAIVLAILYAEGMMVIGTVAFLVFPSQLLSIFEASEQMLAIGVPALRVISFSFLLAGVNIIASTVFQSLGHSMYSLYLSLLRQIVILLPAAYLLSLAGPVEGVWWSFPIAEVGCFALCVAMLVHLYRKIVQPMLAQAQ